jgi:hypothetical protein
MINITQNYSQHLLTILNRVIEARPELDTPKKTALAMFLGKSPASIRSIFEGKPKITLITADEILCKASTELSIYTTMYADHLADQVAVTLLKNNLSPSYMALEFGINNIMFTQITKRCSKSYLSTADRIIDMINSKGGGYWYV